MNLTLNFKVSQRWIVSAWTMDGRSWESVVDNVEERNALVHELSAMPGITGCTWELDRGNPNFRPHEHQQLLAAR